MTDFFQEAFNLILERLDDLVAQVERVANALEGGSDDEQG